jgi:hypothetical protein
MTTLIPKYDQGSTGAVNRPINLKLGETISVKDFGAVGNNIADDTAAIQAAINTGKAVFFPAGVYKITATLTSSGDDFILVGETYDAMSEKNVGASDSIGSVINYYGSTSTPVINPQNIPGQTNQIAICNMTITAQKTFANAIVNLPGSDVVGNDYAAQVTMDNVRLETRDWTGSLNGYGSAGLVLDSADGFFFGSTFTNIYIFGVQQGILLSCTGFFMNSNSFTNIKMYQVWRAIYLFVDNPGSTIYANMFNSVWVQPNTQAGVFADGLILLDGDVSQNTFIGCNIYDTTATTCYKVINPVTNNGNNNIFINCISNDQNTPLPTMPGWGLSNWGYLNAQHINIQVGDASTDPNRTLMFITDQNQSQILYPRNGAANDLLFKMGNANNALTLRYSGTMLPMQMSTAAAAAYYEKGAIYFDTTLNKLRVGGATAWETITSV